jgi:uncharacterized membrane protein
MMWALAAWSLFVLSLVLRGGVRAKRPSLVAMMVAAGAAVALTMPGWMGDRVVYHFGVSVSYPARHLESD